jgi:hypothetical protein
MTVIHLVGNGDNAHFYNQGSKGLKVTCNLPPFPVEGAYTTVMVDFKMMNAIETGGVTVPGEWTLGLRPKMYCEMRPNFYMKYAPQIKEFYTVLPKYVANYTDFNCGHMAAHYCANKLKGTEIHLYGFDSVFDMNLRSCTDFYLNSDRGANNNVRLNDNWRPIWRNMFMEFSNVQWVLHHKHDQLKFPKPENVDIQVHSR